MKSVITITFSESVENHIGMQQIGKISRFGFTKKDLNEIKKRFEQENFETKFVYLNGPILDKKADLAYILIIRNAINKVLNDNLGNDKVFNELTNKIVWDDKYFDTRRKKVLHKRARKNICISDKSQAPDYINKKGTIVSWEQLPYLNEFRSRISKIIGEKAINLKAEGNLYPEPTKHGIGFHGDTERRRVIAIRLGEKESMPLYYQWYYKSQPVGHKIKINLNAGDMYIMSEKAVGTDWKKRNVFTLRHATGAEKYTGEKKKLKLKLKRCF